MTRAAAAVAVMGLAGAARADDGTPASEHARHSTTLYLSTTWSPDPTVSIRAGIDTALRLHRGHIALETRLGFGVAASPLGLGGHAIAHGGLSLGGAFSIGRHVTVAPMLAYDAFAEIERYGSDVWTQYATVALPVSLVLERRVVVELLVQAGVAHYLGATDPALVAGPRIGLVF